MTSEMLDLVGLAAAARRTRAGDLPYGDQRRLELVRALATRPRLLMLDEPAAGMDASRDAGRCCGSSTTSADRYRPRGHRGRARHGPDHESVRAHPGAGAWRASSSRARRPRCRPIRGSGRSISAMPERAQPHRALARRPQRRCSRCRPARQLRRGRGDPGREPRCGRRARWWRCSAPTAPARAPCCAPFPGSSRPRSGEIRFLGEAIDGCRRRGSCAWASPIRPEGGAVSSAADRGGESAPRCRRTGRPRRHRRGPRAHLRPVPDPARAHGASRPARCRAASSRCWRSRRALMARPRLLLLDEPSLGLAPLLVQQIFAHTGGTQAPRA